MNIRISLVRPYLKCFSFHQINHLSTSVTKHGGKKTALYDWHKKNEGKMVEFAGYQMPIQFGKVGIVSSHMNVRKSCGLFDVSHMLQTKFYGVDHIEFFEKIIVGDLQSLAPNTGMLSLFTNEDGGILDDLICTKVSKESDYLYVVSNAGCRDKDLAHIKEKLRQFKSTGGDVEMEILEDFGLVALQGPAAASILDAQTPEDLTKLHFMKSVVTTVTGIPCRITRCGYTGEDGFEISVVNNQIENLCETLVSTAEGKVQVAGLGARDSLRLEAGLCLYGNDLDETITPIEAGLAWTIGKRRRQMKDFPGSTVILQQLKDKPTRRRVGLVSEGPPARAGCAVLDQEGNPIGKITSGCPSPSLGKNIAMAYVPTALTKPGTQLCVQVRSKKIMAEVTKMPFIKSNYYTVKK